MGVCERVSDGGRFGEGGWLPLFYLLIYTHFFFFFFWWAGTISQFNTVTLR